MRIWITGVGVVSPLGRGASKTMDRLLAGDRGFGDVTLFDIEGLRSNIAAQVDDLSADEAAPGGSDAGWSRTDAMAVIAAREALSQAGLSPHREVVDFLLGGTTAGMYETEDLLAQLARDPGSMTPLRRMLSHPLSSTADHVRAIVGPFRRARSVCSACSSGANAILLGAQWLRSGRSTAVLAGGADGLCRLTFTGFGALSALDPAPCRPFDRTRAGLNLGEGAGFVVLEPEALARARGAKPIAELRGWAVGAEAHHITNPDQTGRTAARVMREALSRARLTPRELDYINAHGTATPLNDSMETTAIRDCLGSEVERVAVSSSKGQIGHTLGAAGAIEAVITALALERGVAPPTVGLADVDDACRLRHVPRAMPMNMRAAMSNSFGFGGTDTALVLTRVDAFDEIAVPPPRRVVVTGVGTVGPLGVCGADGTTAYLEEGPPPPAGPIDFNAKEHLDVGRARRLDRAGRLTAVAVQTALGDAGELDPRGRERAPDGRELADPRHGVGAIVGASFGSVDASTAYMRRIYDRGAKFASPADFPNLVPSSPVGHASIYLGLRGPVFAMSDLGATAEAGAVSAVELLSMGEADVMVAGSVEEASPTIELVLGPLCSGSKKGDVRSEGAAVLVFEEALHADKRGARALAEVVWWTEWRTDETPGAARGSEAEGLRGALDGAPPPRSSDDASSAAMVVTGDAEATAHVTRGTPWEKTLVRDVSRRTGSHEGAGGFAMAAAAAELGRGVVARALVVGSVPGRGYALVLDATSASGARDASDG